MDFNPLRPFAFRLPTELKMGRGCLASVGEVTGELGCRPLIVAGRRSARESGALDHLMAALPGAVLFDGIEENPTALACDTGSKACREHACDVVVALGGGSAMDAAKAIAGLARNPGPCASYLGSETFRQGALPIVAIPTTAGTGSEVTPYAVLVDRPEPADNPGIKRSISARCLFPKVAMLDPELTLSMPRAVTASTGLDALSQAMEGMVSKKSTPLGDVLALEVCRIIRRWLPVAVADGNDIEAREQMIYAATLAGIVLAQSGSTLVHGMGYPLTLYSGVPHGLANALLLTPLFQFNALHVPEKVARLSEALGMACAPEPGAARDAIGEAVHTLLLECGISPAGKDAGVNPALLPRFATDVAADPYRYRNQIGPITEEVVMGFYEMAHRGARHL